MASKKKTANATAAVAAITLAQIVEATLKGGFTYISPAAAVEFTEAGVAEVNPSVTNANGEIAIRATQKGIDEMSKKTPATSATATTSKPAFALEVGIPIPAVSGRGGRIGTSVYPFDKMEVGHSFFVPNSDDKPEAVKAMASTVSSANRRYAVPATDGSTKLNKAGETVPVMIKTREFSVRAVEGGARIWRVK